MERCIIIGAAEIGDYTRAKKYIKDEDFVIYCDGGLRHFSEGRLERKPDLAVGDFDSYPLEAYQRLEYLSGQTETIVLPCEKDDTDTVFAMKEALRRGYRDFIFLGVIGGRLDHTLGNVYMLEYLAKAGAQGKLIDDFSKIQLISEGQTALVAEDALYFSLLNISGMAQGITIEGAKYPLRNGEIESRYQYGVSNEVLPGQTARITVAKGSLLLITVDKE